MIDLGQMPGTTTTDNAGLVAARRRITALEIEVAIHRRAAELLKDAIGPKGVDAPGGRSQVDETGGASPADVVGAWCGLSRSKRLALEPVRWVLRVAAFQSASLSLLILVRVPRWRAGCTVQKGAHRGDHLRAGGRDRCRQAAGERSGRRRQQLLLTRYLYVRTQSTS
jgi:hypothetical protein